MTSTGTPRKTKKMIDRATIDAGIKMLKATPPKVETEFTQKATVEMATTVAADLFAKGYNAAEVRKMVIKAFGLDLNPATVGSYLKGAPVETPAKSRSKKKSKGKAGKNEVAAESAPSPAEDAGQTAVQTPDASEHRPSADAPALHADIPKAPADDPRQTAEQTPEALDHAQGEDAQEPQPEIVNTPVEANVAVVTDASSDEEPDKMQQFLDEFDRDAADAVTDDASASPHATTDAEDL